MSKHLKIGKKILILTSLMLMISTARLCADDAKLIKKLNEYQVTILSQQTEILGYQKEVKMYKSNANEEGFWKFVWQVSTAVMATLWVTK